MADENKNMMQGDPGGEASDAPRENMIATAIKFLQNPKVTQSPPSQKRTFLEKKGLSKGEIDLAFSRAGVSETVSTSPPDGSVVPQTGVFHPGVQPQAVAVPVSRWTRFRDYAATAIVVGGITYAMYKLYKKYLMPLWYGPSQEERQLQAIQQSLNTLQQNIQETLTSIKNMQDTVSSQQKQIEAISGSPGDKREHVGHFVNEVKDEIKSLKGLMLGRKQFPPTPMTQPVVPAWQLNASKPEENTTEVISTDETNSSAENDVTMETSEEHVNHLEEETPRDFTKDPVLENKGEETPPIFDGHLTNGDADSAEDVAEEGVIHVQDSSSISSTESKKTDILSKSVITHPAETAEPEAPAS